MKCGNTRCDKEVFGEGFDYCLDHAYMESLGLIQKIQGAEKAIEPSQLDRIEEKLNRLLRVSPAYSRCLCGIQRDCPLHPRREQ